MDTLEKERKEMEETLERIKQESKDPLIGKKLNGGHTIVRPLGSGGMGAVYLAYDFDLGQKVVVKILQPQFADEQTLKDRFQQEAQMLVGLRHPAIPAVNYLDKSGPWFLVMEFCEGESLAEFLYHNRERRTNMAFQMQLVEPFFGVIDALALAHSKGIIHRDIKPDNIMVQTFETGALTMKLIDFGIAKASRKPAQTVEGAILGTLGYLSPEQLMGRTITKLSDVYSLGAVLYEVFAGQEFIQPSNNMMEMTGRAMNLLYVQERLNLLPVHMRALVGLMLEMQARDRLGGMYEVEGGLKYVQRLIEIVADGGQINGNELDVSMELTSSKKVDGNLELLGVQRVIKRQLDIGRNNVMVTAEVPAVQLEVVHPSSDLAGSSVDVSFSSIFRSGPQVSSPDFRASDLDLPDLPAPAAVRAPPLAPVPSMVPAPAPAPEAKKSGWVPVAVGLGLVLILAFFGMLHLSGRKDKKAQKPSGASAMQMQTGTDAADVVVVTQFDAAPATEQADALVLSDAQAPAAEQADASLPGPEVLVEKDASAAPASESPEKQKPFEDIYKSLEEICKNSEGGQKLWSIPNFRAYCVRMETANLPDLEMQLRVLRHNKIKYCRPGLRHWEKAQPDECKTHDNWIKRVMSRIWLRDNPNFKPAPMKTSSGRPPPKLKQKPPPTPPKPPPKSRRWPY